MEGLQALKMREVLSLEGSSEAPRKGLRARTELEFIEIGAEVS